MNEDKLPIEKCRFSVAMLVISRKGRNICFLKQVEIPKTSIPVAKRTPTTGFPGFFLVFVGQNRVDS